MRVLLTSTSIEEKNRFPHNDNGPYPLGLAYLYSFLEMHGFEIRLEFLNNFPLEFAEKKLLDEIERWTPEVVGFQIFSMTRVSTFTIIEKIHNTFPEVKIIIGGVHPSILFQQILEKYPYIIAVLGEGELTTLDLLNSMMNSSPIDAVKGIAFVEKGKIIQTAPRDLIPNLDLLPFPKHEVFFEGASRYIAHMITSRGCPFDCSFCCLKIISKRKLRKRNIHKVVEEIVYLKKKYPRLGHIQFHDDTFLIDNERVIEFCRVLIQKNLGITFECSARVKPISKEMFFWLEKAGCTKIMFGLETGSEELLLSIHKGISKKDVLNLFHVLKEFNFIVTTFLMCGFPGESEKTIQETINFVRKFQKIKYSWIAGIGKLWVYPGTEVYQKMKEANHINDEFWLTEEDVPYYTVERSFEDLVAFENQLMDGVSLERIFTIKGFLNHFIKMPSQIIQFLRAHPEHFPRLVSNGHILVRIVSRVLRKIRSSFREVGTIGKAFLKYTRFSRD